MVHSGSRNSIELRGWACGVYLLVVLGVTADTKSLQTHDYSFALSNPPPAEQPSALSADSAPGPQFIPPEMERRTPILNFELGDNAYDENAGSSSMENAFLSYLYRKHMLQKMKQIEASTLQQQRKRTNGNYWKMCAFNAVSCFG